MVFVIVVAALVVLLLLMLVGAFNGLVRRRNACNAAFSQVDVQLTKRHDLVPNLVAAVSGYAKHERETLSAVTAARTSAIAAKGPADKAAAEQGLTAAIGGVLAVAEAYPDLKASGNFLELEQQLGSIETAIAYSRQYYNDAVQTYETSRTTLPRVLVAGMLGFHEREYFKADAGAAAPVAVQF